MTSRFLPSFAVLVAACSSPAEVSVDASTGVDATSEADASIDAPSCTTDGKIYYVEGPSTSVRINTIDGVLTGGAKVADITCPAAPTALGVLQNGSMFLALAGGGIAQASATACTPITVTPAFTGDLALVGVGNELLALERGNGKLWRVDPATGAASQLSTIAGVTASTVLVGGELGAKVYIPALLVGQGSLIPLDAQGHPGTATTITGASSVQAQANWVAVVGDASKLWMTCSGYYGAGGGRRTKWIPLENNTADSAAYDYYASTVAVSAATCP